MLSITENTENNIIEVKISGKLETHDFKDLAVYVDNLISEHGTIKLLINAEEFHGWKNFESAEEHFNFVKDHHKNVECIALIAGYEWQHWVAAFAGVFVFPYIKVFSPDKISEAKNWLELYEDI